MCEANYTPYTFAHDLNWVNFSLGKQPIPQEQYRQIQIIDHLIPLRGYQNFSLGGVVRPQTRAWFSHAAISALAVSRDTHC